MAILLPRKFFITATNENYVLLSLFISLTKSWSRTCVQIRDPSNTPALIYSNDKAGRTETMCWKHSLSVFNTLTNCFIRPSLMCWDRNMTFSWLMIASLTIFSIPTSRVSCKGLYFWFQYLPLARLSNIQIKQGSFVNPLCWPRRKFTVLMW